MAILVPRRIPWRRKPSASPSANPSFPPPTYAWWLGESAGNKTRSIAKSNEATIEAFGTSFVWGNGDKGIVLSGISASNDAINTGIPLTSGSADRTIIVRYRPDSGALSGNKIICGAGKPGTAGAKWIFRLDVGALRIEIEGSGYTSSLSPTTDKFQIMACRLKGTTLGDHTLYLDRSSEQPTGTNTLNTSTENNTGFFGNTIAQTSATGATGDIDYILWYDSAIDENQINSLADEPYAWLKPRRRFTLIQGGAGAGVTINADPLTTTSSVSANVQIGVNQSADPLTTSSSLAASVSTGVDVSADPLLSSLAISADTYVGANVSGTLSVTTALSASVSTGAVIGADPIISAVSLSGASIIGVNQSADPLTAVSTLSADVQAGAGVNVSASPLTVTTDISGQPVIGVVYSADAIVVSSSLLANAYVGVNVGDTLSAETQLSGNVQAAGGVNISASPLTSVSALHGQPIIGVGITAIPLSAFSSLSASTVIGVNQSASPLTLTAALFGQVTAGSVVINTDATETLILTAENPTLNLS